MRNYRDEYINNFKVNESCKITVINFFKRINKFELKIRKNLEDGYSKEQFINLLSSFNNTNVPSFLNCKSTIKKYIEYLCDNNVLDKCYLSNIESVNYDDIDTAHVFDMKFYKNFKTLQDAIELCLMVANRIDERIFSTQIAAIYMAWCGVKLEDALLIKKEDVKEDCIYVNGKPIFPNSTILEFIKDYRDETEYNSQARTVVTFKYVPSEWLFRSTKAGQIDEKNMRIFIRNLGKYGTDDGKGSILNYDKIYWSGIYCRAYAYECENGVIQVGDTQTINKVFQENNTKLLANKRLRAYRRYAEYFFGVEFPT